MVPRGKKRRSVAAGELSYAGIVHTGNNFSVQCVCAENDFYHLHYIFNQ